MSHAHLQYAYNICAKFKIDCFKTLGRVVYANWLLYIEAEPQIKKMLQFCQKLIFHSFKKTHAYLHYAYKNYAKSESKISN